MSNKRQRTLQRVVHLAGGVLLILYLYTSAADLPGAEPLVRFVLVPVLVLSGLTMWQLPRLRQRLKQRSMPVRPERA